ncbi:MAG: hypothetical protein IJ794_16065 [Lachnospiraceae bacterium]|nr:hypothetical protein [Lachnospiraceae bacterium]
MIAFSCASYIQLIRAFQMHMRMDLFMEEADLYLVHKMFDNPALLNNIESTRVFRNVYYFDVETEGRMKLLKDWNSFKKKFNNLDYNKLISFNVENVVSCFIYNHNKNHDRFEYHCAEDTPSIYKLYIPKNKKHIDPYKVLGLDRECFHIKTWWSGVPDLMNIPHMFTKDIRKLPTIDVNDKELLQTINNAFGYTGNMYMEDTDVLFMEESHYTDGILPSNMDCVLFTSIRERYPHLKMQIKLHPRTKDNRFEGVIDELDVSKLPWELIAWNRIKETEKPLVQVGIACGTLLSDKVLFDYEGPKIALIKMFKKAIQPKDGIYRVDDWLVDSYVKFRNDFKKPENFYMPELEEDIYSAMDKIFQK